MKMNVDTEIGTQMEDSVNNTGKTPSISQRTRKEAWERFPLTDFRRNHS